MLLVVDYYMIVRIKRSNQSLVYYPMLQTRNEHHAHLVPTSVLPSVHSDYLMALRDGWVLILLLVLPTTLLSKSSRAVVQKGRESQSMTWNMCLWEKTTRRGRSARPDILTTDVSQLQCPRSYNQTSA